MNGVIKKRGRHTLYGKRLEQRGQGMTEERWQEIDRLAADEDVSSGELVRRLVDEALVARSRRRKSASPQSPAA